MALNWSMDRGVGATAAATAGEAAGLTAGEGAASGEGEDATAGDAAAAGDAAGLGAAVGATVGAAAGAVVGAAVGAAAGAVVGAAVGVGGACEQPASPATKPANASNAQRLSAPGKMLSSFLLTETRVVSGQQPVIDWQCARPSAAGQASSARLRSRREFTSSHASDYPPRWRGRGVGVGSGATAPDASPRR
jgi:hypothetical protein